jgi:plastocyanin
MRALRLLPLPALAGLLLAATPAAGVNLAQAGGDARIVDFDFAPRTLTVDVGTKVRWTNTGQRPHTATDRGGTFDTRPVAPGASAEVTFSAPGTYFYFCRINPAKMNGTVVVKPGDQPAKVTRVQAVDPGFTGDKLRFDPAKLTVAAGSTLLVANVGGKPHTLTADDGSFDTGAITPGAEGGRFAGRNASITLTEPGTFRFHCEVHPAAMKGVVTVTGEAGGQAPAAASAGPREIDIGASDFAFDPKDASIAPGGKVTVTNKGQATHTLTLDDQPRDTSQIAPGTTADLTAPDKPGSYSYRCTVHPARMRGVLVVLARDTDDPNADAAQAAPAVQVAPSGGGGGPAGGITAFGLATGLLAAFLGGIGLSAFALRRRGAGG